MCREEPRCLPGDLACEVQALSGLSGRSRPSLRASLPQNVAKLRPGGIHAEANGIFAPPANSGVSGGPGVSGNG